MPEVCAAGLSGADLLALSRAAGASPEVSSFELVEINPHFDVDGRSVRWAAVGIWEFLVALRKRRK